MLSGATVELPVMNLQLKRQKKARKLIVNDVQYMIWPRKWVLLIGASNSFVKWTRLSLKVSIQIYNSEEQKLLWKEMNVVIITIL